MPRAKLMFIELLLDFGFYEGLYRDGARLRY